MYLKKRKKKKWLWNRKKETDISEVLLGDKKISKSGREKICFKDNNFKKKIAHPIHLQKCRRTECIELSGRLSRNM